MASNEVANPSRGMDPVSQMEGATSVFPSGLDRAAFDAVHQALLGIPSDQETPTYITDIADLHEAALALVDSHRFRWSVRGRVAPWPHDKWVCTDFQGRNGEFRLWVNLHDGFVSFGVLHDDWENGEVEFMLSRLRSGDCVLDIGGNVGVFAVQAARAVGLQGRVHSFEASPTVGAMLQRSVYDNHLDSICTVHRFGLGDRDVRGRFHRSEHSTNPGASYVSSDADRLDGPGERIELRRLDSLGLDRRVAFIKMDVEGFEERIVQGGRALIGKDRPTVLSEFFPRSLRLIGGGSGSSYIALWEELGYHVRLLTGGAPVKQVTSGDAAQYDDVPEPLTIVCEPTETLPLT